MVWFCLVSFLYLVTRRFLLGLGRHLDQDEGVEEVRFNAGRREVGAVRLEENDADDVVTYVTFSLELPHKTIIDKPISNVSIDGCFPALESIEFHFFQQIRFPVERGRGTGIK